MPRAFLSYSHHDAAFVADLEGRLPAAGWDVWRDVHSLRAGDRWPRKLGDAIAASEAFVLVWSAHAALSDFIELEWTIAVAAKRSICILTLDSQPLPSTLLPYQAHLAVPPAKAAEWLSGITLEKTHANAATPVLKTLADTPHADPSQITAGLTAVFLQSGWNVSGAVYQSAGDMHVYLDNQQKPPARGNTRRPLYIVAAVVILAIVIAAVYKLTAPRKSPASMEATSTQPFGGFVQDERGLPLDGVGVTAPNQGITVITDRFGRFSFQVPLPANINFRLVATKPGFEVLTADPPAGDTDFNFTLKKSAKTQ